MAGLCEIETGLYGLAVVVITEDVQNVHLLLEYRPHIDVSLICEHDPKFQEYCVCPQNMPRFDSEGIPNQAPETNKPMILNGPTRRNREGSHQFIAVFNVIEAVQIYKNKVSQKLDEAVLATTHSTRTWSHITSSLKKMAELAVESLEANLQLTWPRTREELFYIKRRESLKSYIEEEEEEEEEEEDDDDDDDDDDYIILIILKNPDQCKQ
ncbi:hypothetical protein ANN_12317 [Periplaneta americana]|uniref:Uncharacterized protein n=1 Tax=Periplaneta americana TaxID=6978 RepID=A0ABQ8TIY2_PERAM|nr:hypothetical protein ANN_12317 [Periplaneta americana]